MYFLYCIFIFISLMLYFSLFYFFFFSSRRRHTRCSRDWSSDVCSSDLGSFSPSCSFAGPLALFFDTVKSAMPTRSEERRVGKECRSRWSACHQKKKEREHRGLFTLRFGKVGQDLDDRGATEP